MISPVSGNAWEPAAEVTSAERRRKIARKWAYLVSLTAYLPLPHADIERELQDLVTRVFDAMTSEPLPTDRVAEVGARLVELHCVGKASLQCTVDVLAGALLAEPELRRFDRLPERVAHLLGALASGYVEATRLSTLEQQDNLHRALLEAMWVSERRHRTSKSWLDEVLTCSSSGIAITDLDGRFVRANAAFNRILVRSSAESTLFELLRPRGSADLRGAYSELLDGQRDRLELRPELLRPNDESAPLALVASLLRDADGQPSNYVTIVDDTELTTLRGQLNHQVLHDLVTGLPNRQYFSTRLKQVLHSAKPTTLYELDLDGFSGLTDGLGRQIGEQLLRAVAARLEAVVAEAEEGRAGGEAMVARFDGGTFAILVGSSPTAPDTVTMIKGINRALAEPVRIDGLRVPISVSIGVVHQLSRDADPADLIHAADLALRRAKSNGCGQWALFDPDRDARENLGLTASMPDAWDNGQLRAVYRPVVRLADEHVLAIEALLRWDHPEHGPIPHHRCQELAEHTGLILPLGTHVLRRACEQLRRQRDVPLHINLTRNQSADRDLVDRVLRTLEDTKLPPTRLQLAMPIGDLRGDPIAADNLTALAAAGVQIAIHRFAGTPEDLVCLENHPIRAVHLAPSLVRRQTNSALVTKAVPHLITLIHLVNATVTVDDLTSKPQANSWHLAGADAATGPLFARASLA